MKTLELFREQSSDPKRNAQSNLAGRTHWADPDTLKYFHCRILSSRCYADGRLFYVLFSQARDMRNTRRGYGYIVFAVDGYTIVSTDLDTMASTHDAARNALTKALATIDPEQACEDAIARVRNETEREEQYLREALARIAAKAQQQAEG